MPTKATQHRIAEPGSLRHLLITHSSKRLYVAPDIWTAEHLAFLDCPPPQVITLSASAKSYAPHTHPLWKNGHLENALYLLKFHRGRQRDESIELIFCTLVRLFVTSDTQICNMSRYVPNIEYMRTP